MLLLQCLRMLEKGERICIHQRKHFFQQNIYFSADMKHLPEIVLIDDVTISSPYVHYRRKPKEYLFYYIYDGEMYLTEGDTAYAV